MYWTRNVYRHSAVRCERLMYTGLAYLRFLRRLIFTNSVSTLNFVLNSGNLLLRLVKCQLMMILVQDVRQRRQTMLMWKYEETPEMWTRFLHHDNVPAHSSLSTRKFMREKSHGRAPSSAVSSPDLVPQHTFHYFRNENLHWMLKGQRFTVIEIKENSQTETRAIPKTFAGLLSEVETLLGSILT